MANLTIVIAEDDPKISEIQSRFIDKIEGFEVVGIGNTIAESEEIIDVFQPDLVLLDVFFPDGNGIDLLWKIRRLYKNIDVILITAAKEVGTLQDAIRGGAFDYVLKPMTFSRFQSTLRKFFEHRTKLNEITNLDQKNVDQIIHPTQDSAEEARIPKSINPLTLERIEEEVKKIDDYGVNAEAMGQQVGIQAIGVIATVAWCGIMTFVLLKVVGMFVDLRVSDDVETQGLDLSEHDERSYSL